MNEKELMNDPTRPIEVQLASEEAMRKNVQAIVARYNIMAKEWAEMKKEIQELKNMVQMRDNSIFEIKRQMSLIQAYLYTSGSATN